MVGIALVALGPASAASATDTTDITGDITPPTLVSFEASVPSVDVTDAPAPITIRAHVTDDLSGTSGPWISYQPPGPGQSSYSTNVVRVSGDDRDGVYEATYTIPRGARPGQYELMAGVGDRVGNTRSWIQPGDLAADGYTGSFQVVDGDPDDTAPNLVSISVSPSVVDVRNGPQTVTVDIRATDDKSGVLGMYVFPHASDEASGGVTPAAMSLASGTNLDGHWTGTMTVPRYTRNDRFRLQVGIMDQLINIHDYPADELVAAGQSSTFDAISNEDRSAPAVRSLTVDRLEVDVHDADQEIHVRTRVTDDLAGVAELWPDHNEHAIEVRFDDPVSRQGGGAGGLARTSGDELDGVYEGAFTIPKSSATGLRFPRVATRDRVGNEQYVYDVAPIGGPPAILVYNTPLPPQVRDALPGDRCALVRWLPPVDDRGAAVTDYVVHELPQGIVATVGADVREAVVHGLTNGVRHEFTVEAVNKAGPSDPSDRVATVPSATAPASPGDGSGAVGAAAPSSAAAGRSGYWMVDAAGEVFGFGDAGWMGNAPLPRGNSAVDVEPTASRQGYWVLSDDGDVYAFGDAPYLGGGSANRSLAPGETFTSLSATPTGRGYWLFTSRGRVLTFGDAAFLGDMSATPLNGPVLDSVVTPTGRGYYMVASDGGVFTFGDARFAGSMGGSALNAPVQSLVPDPDGGGYWLVAGDGGIFAFDAGFYGSMGDVRLNRPVSGMVGAGGGGGYLMVGEDGGIFTFGSVPFFGSLGASPPRTPVVAVAAV